MVNREYDNFRRTTMIRFVAAILVLLVPTSLLQANTSDIATTVTVAPQAEALTAGAIAIGTGKW